MSLNTLSEQNKDFIAKLYSLKAGLSMISLEVDKIKEAESSLKAQEKYLRTQQSYLDSSTEQYNSRKNELSQSKKILDGMKKKRNIQLGIVIAEFSIAVIAAIVAAVSFLIFSMASSSEAEILSDISLIALPFGMLGLVIAFFAAIFPLFRISKTKKQPHEIYLISEYEKNNSYITRIKNDCEKYKDSVELAKATYDTVKLRSEITVRNSTDEAAAIFNALYETYNDTLDINNWQGIDYIIYAYTTGRADNLSDALRFLDEERRYEGMVAAIDRASVQIATTINQAFSALSYQLSQNFASLENTIKKNTNTIVSSIDSLNSNVKSINSSIDELGNGIAMQNALQRKSNESTKKLAEDMNYITTRIRAGS